MSVSQPLPLTATTDLSKDSIVFLQVRQGVVSYVHVIARTQEEFFFDIGPGDTVIDLKLKILERKGVPPDQQRLHYGGKLLEGTI